MAARTKFSLEEYEEASSRLASRIRRMAPRRLRQFGRIFSITNLVGFAAGGLAVINLTIAADANNYQLYASAGSPGFPCIVNCTINGGVYVGSTTNGAYAFTVGSAWAVGSKLRLTINGEIQGRSGDGGQGGRIGTTPTAPTAGGPAIDASGFAIEITNNGAARGGGGGGGRGGGRKNQVLIKSICECGTDGQGGAGGGGRGTNPAAASQGGFDFCTSTQATPQATAGSRTAQGTGGTGNASCGNGGDGGLGGATGSTGTDAVSISGTCKAFGVGGPGAAGGACTLGNSNITWIIAGTREGALN